MIVGVNGPYYLTDTLRWNDRDLPLLKDSNIKHIRLGIGVTHEYLDRAIADGFKVIVTLDTTGLPDEAVFKQYVIDQVTRYAGKVEGWVVFNEVNKWTSTGWSFPPSEYIKALKAAHAGIKIADPNALTITSNFMYGDRAAQYMQEIYSLDPTIMSQYDVVALDPYCYPVSPKEPNVDQFGHGFWELQSLQDVMRMNGDNTPVWIVEMGWPTTPCGTSDPRAIDELSQAAYIVQALEMARSWGIERFYIYKWMDSTGEHCMGLIPTQYNPQPDGTYLVKPSYSTVKEFIATPIFPLELLIRAAVSTATGIVLILLSL